ncbi:hypothetical protein C475_15043 [Halosimplex carlsbadense 2-9-1]|uniref:Uncharacterized protein n=2 Tax=Halosimplex carlsbadense TaxID=171164 RepID=M0CLV3_9EURY|nr:hypothetical protein C475_15043 [Halosimplex carlsbadense 2-9-1]
MGGLTGWLKWWTYWFFFEWNLNAVKWKAGIITIFIWTVDTLFFTGLISKIWIAILVVFVGVTALIPSIPTALGAADKLDLINLSKEQSLIRRFFSLIFSDVTEYIELLLDYLFGD